MSRERRRESAENNGERASHANAGFRQVRVPCATVTSWRGILSILSRLPSDSQTSESHTRLTRRHDFRESTSFFPTGLKKRTCSHGNRRAISYASVSSLLENTKFYGSYAKSLCGVLETGHRHCGWIQNSTTRSEGYKEAGGQMKRITEVFRSSASSFSLASCNLLLASSFSFSHKIFFQETPKLLFSTQWLTWTLDSLRAASR